MCDFPVHYMEVESIYNQSIGAGYRSIAVTSVLIGEGKTTLIKALAKRASFAEKKVLVVELNTFNPELSANINKAADDELNQIISTQERSYHLVPAPQNLSEIIRYKESSILNEAMNNWLTQYDCVLFDTSALQSLNQSNIPPEIVCEVCEGAILIIEGGKTPSNLLEEGVLKLKAKKVNLIGTVINDKYNPSLLSEVIRETHRLNKIFPRFMAKLRKTLPSITLLNVSV